MKQKQTAEIDKSSRAAQDINDANMRMWKNKQKHRRKETPHGMKFATFQTFKDTAQTTLCKQPELLSWVSREKLATNTENDSVFKIRKNVDEYAHSRACKHHSLSTSLPSNFCGIVEEYVPVIVVWCNNEKEEEEGKQHHPPGGREKAAPLRGGRKAAPPKKGRKEKAATLKRREGGK